MDLGAASAAFSRSDAPLISSPRNYAVGALKRRESTFIQPVNQRGSRRVFLTGRRLGASPRRAAPQTADQAGLSPFSSFHLYFIPLSARRFLCPYFTSTPLCYYLRLAPFPFPVRAEVPFRAQTRFSVPAAAAAPRRKVLSRGLSFASYYRIASKEKLPFPSDTHIERRGKSIANLRETRAFHKLPMDRKIMPLIMLLFLRGGVVAYFLHCVQKCLILNHYCHRLYIFVYNLRLCNVNLKFKANSLIITKIAAQMNKLINILKYVSKLRNKYIS